MPAYSITIPDKLNWSHSEFETVLEMINANLDHSQIVYNMQEVRFVNPYGTLMLLAAARYVAQRTDHRTCLVNMRPEVHAYLERMDFFFQGASWLYTNEPLLEHQRLSRNETPDGLLEITPLSSPKAIPKFISRAQSILDNWLNTSQQEVDLITSILEEICTNVDDHSEDIGHAMIQRYVRKNHIEIQIGVIDLGVGIPGSLSRHHSSKANRDDEFILLALQGYTARAEREGGGGAGLQAIQNRLEQKGGRLVIRSNTGLVIAGGGKEPRAFLGSYLPGTQVSVKVRS